jgi:PhnB protein
MNQIPEGYNTITPYLTMKGARAFLDFIKTAFHAEEIEISKGEDGTIYNAEIRIGTSMLMAGDCRDHAPRPGTLYLYVTDPDKLFERAIAAGAKSVCPMTDQFYGDRAGGVEDAWGNQWWLAKRIKSVSAQEVAKFKDQSNKQ